jgi:hypothetical protein
MVRQYSDRDRPKGIPLLNGSIDGSKPIDLAHQKIAGTIGKRHREEEGATFGFQTAVA